MVRIFIEGEPPLLQTAAPPNPVPNLNGLFSTANINLQEAFSRFFAEAGLPRTLHTVTMSGSTQGAMKQFAQAAIQGEPAFLLIDTDGETKAHRLNTVREKIKAANKNIVDITIFDDRIFFMEQAFEAWFLYEDVITRWYNTQQTDRNLQLKQGESIAQNVEIVLNDQQPFLINKPDKALHKILQNTFETLREGAIIPKGYKSKVKDGAAFLLATNVNNLQNRFEEVKRLIEQLKM
jgi:hypothetical protein